MFQHGAAPLAALPFSSMVFSGGAIRRCSLAFLIMRKFFPVVASAALSLGLGLTAASYQQRIMAAPSAAAAAPFAAPFLLFFTGASASLLLGCAAAGDAAGRRS